MNFTFIYIYTKKNVFNIKFVIKSDARDLDEIDGSACAVNRIIGCPSVDSTKEYENAVTFTRIPFHFKLVICNRNVVKNNHTETVDVAKYHEAIDAIWEP